MQVERYRIVLAGWVVSGRQTREVVTELSRLFKIPESKVRPLLAGRSSIIRRDLTLEKAERLRNKIEQRGAVCSLKLVMRYEDQLQGQDSEHMDFPEPDLNMESTQFVLTDEFKKKSPLMPPMFTPKKAEVKRRSQYWSSALLLFVILFVAVAWGVLQLRADKEGAEAVYDVFTLSPAKDEAKK